MGPITAGAMGTSLGITGTNNVTTGINTSPWVVNNTQFLAPVQPQWQFTLVKNQNGFILHFGDKSWICMNMEEVQQNFMVAMVEHRIEK